MTFLIDGYNLLHAVGWAPPRSKGRSLEGARRKLLDWLAEAAGRHPGVTLRVVFDSHRDTSDLANWTHHGVRVQFARGGTADDAIEDALDAAPNPRDITVVSNDTRLHEAARRTESSAWGSQRFLDWVIATERATPKGKVAPPEKPDGPADAAEVTDLLRAFEQPKPR